MESGGSPPATWRQEGGWSRGKTGAAVAGCVLVPWEKVGDDGPGRCYPSFQFSIIGGI
jgi:hypothetical protein